MEAKHTPELCPRCGINPAAVPKLVEACEAALTLLDGFNGTFPVATMLSEALALAKGEGVTP